VCCCVADKWGFTPLHEVAQKGRTQLCALLLAHGADPALKNQEGQTPLDLASADDIKCLLQVGKIFFSVPVPRYLSYILFTVCVSTHEPM